MFHEFDGDYGSPEELLWENFFSPKDYPLDSPLEHLSSLYGSQERKGAKGDNRHRPLLSSGWHIVPRTEDNPSEDSVAKALIQIINAITNLPSEGKPVRNRVALDGQNKSTSCKDGSKLRPDIFIWDHDPEYFPPSATIPTANVQDSSPFLNWSRCLLPFEAKTEKTRGKSLQDQEGLVAQPLKNRHNTAILVSETMSSTSSETTMPPERDGASSKKDHGLPGSGGVFQMATYVREIFAAQPHRRFVITLLFTECTVEFFLWDHAGVMYSKRMDYHKEAERFCQIIYDLMVVWDSHEVGFDQTVKFRFDQDVPRLHVTNPIGKVYLVEKVITHSYCVRNHGTVCYLAVLANERDKWKYLVQDSWTPPKQLLGEASPSPHSKLLSLVESVRIAEDIDGLLEFVGDACVGEEASFDSIHVIRRGVGTTRVKDLHHRRDVYKCSSESYDSFDQFGTPLGLACCIRDILEGTVCVDYLVEDTI